LLFFVQELGGGFVNQLWLCSHPEEQLVVRINPADNRLPFVDRDYEAQTMEYMHTLQLVPKYYGRFQNGLVYQFARGVNPSEQDMENEAVMKLIVDKIYRIHSAGVPKKTTYSTEKMDSVFHHCLTELPDKVDEAKLEPDIRELFLSAIPSVSFLREEAVKCRRNMEVMYKSFPHVFCHQDLWRMNIVYDKDAQKVEIVDWEAGGYAPAAQDLGCLVQDGSGEATWRKWIELYLERAGIPLDEDVVNRWYTCMLHSTSQMYLGVCFWVLWTISLTQDKQQQMCLVKSAIERYNNYMNLKKRGHQEQEKM
jgi:thiamine kinase-like enzyme